MPTTLQKYEMSAIFSAVGWGAFALWLCSPALAQEDPLKLLGTRATKGAAADYVPDKVCGTCHAEIYKTYQHVGMAKSFGKPGEVEVIEDFGKTFYHKPSQRYYEIHKKGDSLTFKRYNRDDEGLPINVFEQAIAWVMGSGNRARSYIYRNDWGEMFELPLGWYSEIDGWGMSPGFEAADHQGVSRQIKRECMYCHNAFPEVPENSDLFWKHDKFPEELPQGTGCQRCHGPGAAHIRTAFSGAPPEAIREKIVNPRKLEPQARDSVCFQCHMLPAVAMVGMRKFDRPIYSFRPGQLLSDYQVHVDITEEGVSKKDRFEINHHGYRFWSSDCYQKSAGELACISCHNPHVKPESKAFRAKVGGVCLGCHEGLDKTHPAEPKAVGDCVGCHMPTRRTRDVVLVTMTDHRIARGPFDHKELLAPLEKKTPTITGIEVLPFGQPPTGVEANLYRMATTLRTLSQPSVLRVYRRTLAGSRENGLVPYLQLAKSQVSLRDYNNATQTVKYLLERDKSLTMAENWLGVIQIGQGKAKQAIETLRASVEREPSPDTHYNLALAAVTLEDHKLALTHLDKAIEMRPNLSKAWLYKGRMHDHLGQQDVGRKAMIRSLEIDPGDSDAYEHLVKLLRRMGKKDEANRFLSVGLRVAREPESLSALKKAD